MEERLRIGMFLHSWAEGGAQRRTIALAGALAERGLAVDLLVVRDEGPLKALVPTTVQIRTVGGLFSRLPRIRSRRSRQVRAAIPSLAWYLRTARPAALISAANHTALATVRAHRLSGCADVALILRVSNALTSRDRVNADDRESAMRDALRRVDAVAAVSTALSREVAALCSTPRPEIHVTANPVLERVDLTAPLAPRPHGSDGPLIVGVGRLVPQKDFATLIRAFSLLSARHRARLVILGEGQERDALVQLACDLGVADRVELPGRVDDPLAWLRKAQVFALSSRWEGMPGSLIEAMACGCPVVSTDTPGAREVLLDGQLAPLVSPGDVHALARAIADRLDRVVDTAPLVDRASRFTITAATHDFLRVIRSAIATRRARGAASTPDRSPATS